MGILKRKGPPAGREPVVLINDPFFGDGSSECNAQSDQRPTWAEDLVVDFRLDSGSSTPLPGVDAFVMCRPGEPPSVWAADPVPRKVGHLIGPTADFVADFIRCAHGGLGAAIGGTPGPTSLEVLQVRIPGSARPA